VFKLISPLRWGFGCDGLISAVCIEFRANLPLVTRRPAPRSPSPIFLILCLTAQLLIPIATGLAQSQSQPPALAESTQDLIAKLSPQQRQKFDDALQAFKARRYADALTNVRALLAELPGDALLSKFACESALNLGDRSFAVTVVKPIADADPSDWQAAALLTRACAESGDASCRDRGMAHMIDLHRQGVTPNGMRDYAVEHIAVGENALEIRASLEPWGYYKVYDLGRVSDAQGSVFLRITLESSDADQGLFAREHPKEAAAGMRSFSLDAYRETGLNGNGQRTQTHYTYKFFVGEPPYETVREEFIKVADGTSTPLSSRSNLRVP
jgi:hypothetical protein